MVVPEPRGTSFKAAWNDTDESIIKVYGDSPAKRKSGPQ
jgi:hypothetical protein